MSDIPQVAIDRAVETVSRLELMTEAGPERIGRPDAEFILSACVSVIAEAAVEGEREKTRLRIKAIVPYPSDGPGAEAVYRFKAKLLAAIDKEGEQDAPENR